MSLAGGNSKGAIAYDDDDEIINEISAGSKLHAHAMHAPFHCASSTSVLVEFIAASITFICAIMWLAVTSTIAKIGSEWHQTN